MYNLAFAPRIIFACPHHSSRTRWRRTAASLGPSAKIEMANRRVESRLPPADLRKEAWPSPSLQLSGFRLACSSGGEGRDGGAEGCGGGGSGVVKCGTAFVIMNFYFFLVCDLVLVGRVGELLQQNRA